MSIDSCVDVRNVGCIASDWRYLWLPFLTALVIGWPALLGLTAAAIMRARVTSALYFAGALFLTLRAYDDYLSYVYEELDAFYLLFVLNLVWLPVLIALAALEAWLKKNIRKGPANAATATSEIVPPQP